MGELRVPIGLLRELVALLEEPGPHVAIEWRAAQPTIVEFVSRRSLDILARCRALLADLEEAGDENG